MNAKLMTSVMALALGFEAYGQTAASSSPPAQTFYPAQQSAPTAGRAGATGGGGGGFGGGFGGGGGFTTSARSSSSYGTRLNSIVARAGGTPATVVAFEPMTPKALEEMQEDLKVFGLIIYRGLERAFGDRSTEYKLGVPMLLQGEHRVVQANYLDGFGVVAKMTVPFPVAASEGEAKTKKEPGAATTEWEKARRALLGGESDLDPDGSAGSPAPAYDEKLVAALKKQMFESIKNGSNLRHVKADEWISVVIVGSGVAEGSRTQGTILAIRVKKSALEGSVEDIEKTAQANAYFDNFENAATMPMSRYQAR